MTSLSSPDDGSLPSVWDMLSSLSYSKLFIGPGMLSGMVGAAVAGGGWRSARKKTLMMDPPKYDMPDKIMIQFAEAFMKTQNT